MVRPSCFVQLVCWASLLLCVNGLLISDCVPSYTTKKAPCLVKIVDCWTQFGISLKWTGEGTVSRKTHRNEGDGGCQCADYCGFLSKRPCRADKICFWEKKSATCYSKLNGLPGIPILECTAASGVSPSKSPSMRSPSKSPSMRSPSKSPSRISPSKSPSQSPHNNLAPVDLGTAANYTILSESGISNTGASDIVGNIGVSPITYAAITGFDLNPVTPTPTTVYATSPYVTGDVFASDYANPTPAQLSTAISDMMTAYTNAAGRTDPNYINFGSGEIGGLTLYPGLYTWSTAVLVTANVVLSGSPGDVWIFQIAQTLTMSSNVLMSLEGGAQAQNIFWQVASGVTMFAGAHLEGEILCATAIILDTGASIHGRALAQTAVTLQGNAIIGV